MNEKLLEQKLVAGVKKLGCKAIKFSSFYETGYPDRLVLIPGGYSWWREIKTTGKKPTPLQEIRMESLEKLGFNVGVIDSQESLDTFLAELNPNSALLGSLF